MNNQTNKQVDFSSWVEKKYREYSLYVSTKRALPHLIDGFKPGQRKIIYVAQMKAKKLIKTVSLSGYVIAIGGFHHGDKSLNDAISLMAQGFTGSNNYPLLNNKGGFGNFMNPTPSAPRYTYVSINDIYYNIFKDEDKNILLKCEDIEDPEPQYYVPIIPNVLLNGISGIAVGFATAIPPYNPKKIMDNIYNIIDGNEKRVDIEPFYKGYSGEIVKEKSGWVMYGAFKRHNTTTLEITEIPIGFTTEKYKNLLNGLIEDGVIKDYDDLSDSSWRFKIRAKRELLSMTDSEIINIFKLKQNISENINVVFDGKIKQYGSDSISVVEDFVKIRLEYYDKRKQQMLQSYKLDILRYWIKYLVNKYVKSKHLDKFLKSEIEDYISKNKKIINNFYDEFVSGYDKSLIDEYLTSNVKQILQDLRINEIYSDKMLELQKNIQNITDTHNKLYNTTVNTLYKNDLNNLKKIFKKD